VLHPVPVPQWRDHCGVGQLRLIPQDLHALISNIFRNRLNPDFLRDHQALRL
jgi:hypothetical protein